MAEIVKEVCGSEFSNCYSESIIESLTLILFEAWLIWSLGTVIIFKRTVWKFIWKCHFVWTSLRHSEEQSFQALTDSFWVNCFFKNNALEERIRTRTGLNLTGKGQWNRWVEKMNWKEEERRREVGHSRAH